MFPVRPRCDGCRGVRLIAYHYRVTGAHADRSRAGAWARSGCARKRLARRAGRLGDTKRKHSASQHARRSGCSLGKRSGRGRADSDSCSTALPSGRGRLTLLVTGQRKEAKPTGVGPVDQRVRPQRAGACGRRMPPWQRQRTSCRPVPFAANSRQQALALQSSILRRWRSRTRACELWRS